MHSEPDPGGQKWHAKIGKWGKFHVLNSWMFSFKSRNFYHPDPFRSPFRPKGFFAVPIPSPFKEGWQPYVQRSCLLRTSGEGGLGFLKSSGQLGCPRPPLLPLVLTSLNILPFTHNSTFLGRKWHLSDGWMLFHRTAKSLHFQGQTPSYLPSWWICTHQNHYVLYGAA